MLCKTTILLHKFFFYFRDSDKLIFERLQKEFEAARAAQTEGIHWNGSLLPSYISKLVNSYMLLFIYMHRDMDVGHG